MTSDVTPIGYSNSWGLNTSLDTRVQRYEEIAPTSTTAYATSVNQTGEAMFGRAIIAKTTYGAVVQSSSTYPVTSASTSTAYTVTRVASSAPVLLVTMTQYGQIVPTNTTVWNSSNSPSSLLLAATGQGNDVVNYKVSLVADSVI